MAALDDFSRFYSTDEIVYNGNETFGRWKEPSFIATKLSDNKISMLVVSSQVEGRPDLISQELYNTPLLDWVLIAFNGVRDPLNWPKAGDTIRFPVESVVFPAI